ncbi:hypothetical protein [Mesobacillus maritimus]|uniref:Uncharacterized protein n=1 Tax=Mesobacillus maritimus TaxID=1643336 RepID=A0ABS7K3P8_9BACI|nr:hypothetical protein [Mesobacillus maritimus]MBY0096883.1 hypothetical protein [Mesobacillus maritimus]
MDYPIHALSIVTTLAYRRYKKGQYPLAFVCMDNCSHNDDILKRAVLTMAKEWAKRGNVEEGFVSYLEDESKITFPLSMMIKLHQIGGLLLQVLVPSDVHLKRI